MSSIPDPNLFICKRCAGENAVPFVGMLYYGQCDFCTARWVDIVETKIKRTGEKVQRESNLKQRLREEPQRETILHAPQVLPQSTVDAIVGMTKGIVEEVRRDANGDAIPWPQSADYFMAFDPDNPDVPTD